jgi:DNA-binding IclR family transcriptional regulator
MAAAYRGSMTVQSIERAFTLLRGLAVGPVGVTELADRVGLPKSTVARLLSALEAAGAVTQDTPGGDYRLGDGLVDIAGAAQPGRNLVATARPHLLELTERVGETSGISVPDGRDMYYLDHAEAEGEIQVRNWTGERCPIHAVPSGLVVMAHWPEKKLDAFLRSDLVRMTSWTVTDANEIRAGLELVRNLGYAWVYEEFAEGINSVAAPIFEADGTVDAAVHIHGPAYRFPDPDHSHDLGIMVIDAASSIAEHLASD